MLDKWAGAREIVVLIGPEGGLTDTERAALRQAGYVAVRLGHTTLRIETAAVALLGAILAMLDAPSG